MEPSNQRLITLETPAESTELLLTLHFVTLQTSQKNTVWLQPLNVKSSIFKYVSIKDTQMLNIHFCCQIAEHQHCLIWSLHHVFVGKNRSVTFFEKHGFISQRLHFSQGHLFQHQTSSSPLDGLKSITFWSRFYKYWCSSLHKVLWIGCAWIRAPRSTDRGWSSEVTSVGCVWMCTCSSLTTELPVLCVNRESRLCCLIKMFLACFWFPGLK